MKRKGTGSFKQVFHNGRRLRGLWSRNGHFYAQMAVETGGLMRVTKMLLEAQTAPKAAEEMAALKRKRDKGTLEKITHAPKLTNAIAEYKASATFASKSPASQRGENTYLDLWQERLGQMSVDKIRKQHILAVRDDITSEGKVSALRKGKVSNRTANLYVQGLRQVLKFQEERGRVAVIPKIKALKLPPERRRELIDDVQFQRILDACTPEVTKNAKLVRFYLRFLALTGTRCKETYRLKWSDVDFERRKVTIGSDGKSKNRRPRDINFNPELETLLAEMKAEHPEDSSYLFPSPQRGEKDKPATTLWDSFKLVREHVKMEHLGFHDFRHLFISKCVMAGVPHMTIAEWVGHRDGGVLIGKVYGHLSEDHKAQAANNLSLFTKPENVTTLKQAAG
jgi:integrase